MFTIIKKPERLEVVEEEQDTRKNGICNRDSKKSFVSKGHGEMDKKICHQDFLRIMRLTFDTAPAVLAAFTDSKVVTNGKSFKSYLDNVKHSLFHKHNPRVYCCKCLDENKKLCSSRNTRPNSEHVFQQLFQTEKALLNKSHEMQTGGVRQICICQFTPSDKSSSDFDMVTLVLLLTESGMLKDYQQKWLSTMKDQRNELCHLSGTTVLTYKQFEGIWNKLEDVIKNFAREVSPGLHFLHSIEREIENLKKTNSTEEQMGSSLHELIEELKEIKDNVDQCKMLGNYLNHIQDGHSSPFVPNINDPNENTGINMTKLEKGNSILLLDSFRKVLGSATITSVDTVSEIVEFKCKIDVPKQWNEHAIVQNLPSTSKDQMTENDLFSIITSEERCITLRLAIKKKVFENDELLHSVIRLLLQKITNAGDIDANVPAFVSFTLELYTEENKGDHKNSQAQAETVDLKEEANTNISCLLTHSKQIADCQNSPLEASTAGILTQIVLDIFPDIIREWIVQYTTEEYILTHMTFFRNKVYTSLKDCNFPTLLEAVRSGRPIEMPFLYRYNYKCQNDSDKQCNDDIIRMEEIYDRIIGTGNSSINEEERYTLLQDIKEILKHFDHYFKKKHDETFEGRFEYLVKYWGFAKEMYSVLDKFGLAFLYPPTEYAHLSKSQYAESMSASTVTSTDSGHFSIRSERKNPFDDDGTLTAKRQTKRAAIPIAFLETGSSES